MAFRHCPQESFLVVMSQSDFHGSSSFIWRVAWSAMRGSRLLVGPPGVVRFEGKQLQEIWWWFSLFYLPPLSLSLKHTLVFKDKREYCNTRCLNQRWRLRKTGPSGASIFDTVWMETVIPPPQSVIAVGSWNVIRSVARTLQHEYT